MNKKTYELPHFKDPCLTLLLSQRAKVNCGNAMFRPRQRNSNVIVTQDLTHLQPGKSTLMTTFVVSCSQLLKYSQRYGQTRRSNRALLSSRQRFGRSHEERDDSGFLDRAAQGTESSHEIQRGPQEPQRNELSKLPIELRVDICEYLSLNDLCSLVLLDRACHEAVSPTLNNRWVTHFELSHAWPNPKPSPTWDYVRYL